ncbi:MAG: hypothetical protein NWP78_04370, partial [Ilumatobacteraceae bacterium]|nr:hypothetical protein [Ilumatobacteraceae bacterium]
MVDGASVSTGTDVVVVVVVLVAVSASGTWSRDSGVKRSSLGRPSYLLPAWNRDYESGTATGGGVDECAPTHGLGMLGDNRQTKTTANGVARGRAARETLEDPNSFADADAST